MPVAGPRSAVVALVAALALPATSLALAGDCDGDGRVSVNELVIAVNISLGLAPLARCPAVDDNGDGRVSVAELVLAVRAAVQTREPQRQAFILTTNFMAGSFATVDLDPPRRVSPSTAQRRLHGDPVVRSHGGLVYVINRLFADNLQVLDPQDEFRTRFQCSTGNGSNPHDIAVAAANKAYITLYERAELLIVNPSARSDCSDFVRGTIDLSSVADADGIPDMDQMIIVGDRLYVSLQRLDINSILRTPATNAALAVIDLATDSLLGTIELAGENPFAATKGLTLHNGLLYLSQVGVIGIADGGIERVDLAAARSGGWVIREGAFGGDITDFVLVTDRHGYAIVSRTDFSTQLVEFDPATGTVGATVFTAPGFTLADIELNDRGELYLADRDRNSGGIRIFRAADAAPLVAQSIDLGLPPFEIVFIP